MSKKPGNAESCMTALCANIESNICFLKNTNRSWAVPDVCFEHPVVRGLAMASCIKTVPQLHVTPQHLPTTTPSELYAQLAGTRFWNQ